VGATNALAAYARWHDLPDLPHRVLVYMALRTMDADDPPLYWAGWEELAVAAGRMIPDHDPHDKAVTKERRAALKSVSAVLRILRDRGAVRLATRPAPGRRAEYALNLDRTTVHAQREPSPVDNPATGRTVRPRGGTNGARSADQRCTLSRPTVHAERAPQEYLGVRGESGVEWPGPPSSDGAPQNGFDNWRSQDLALFKDVVGDAMTSDGSMWTKGTFAADVWYEALRGHKTSPLDWPGRYLGGIQERDGLEDYLAAKGIEMEEPR